MAEANIMKILTKQNLESLFFVAEGEKRTEKVRCQNSSQIKANLAKDMGLPYDFMKIDAFRNYLKDKCGLSYKRNNYVKPSMEDPVTQ